MIIALSVLQYTAEDFVIIMRDNIESLKRILSQITYVLDTQQKKGAIRVFICMIIASFLDLLGVSAIYPFLQMLLDSHELKNKWYVSWIYIIYPEVTDMAVLVFGGMAIIFIYVFKNVFMIGIAYIQNSFAARFQREISVRMLQSYSQRD